MIVGFKQEMTTGAEDFDASGRIKASTLMYMFQETASAHVDTLGLGFDDMITEGRIWVMTKLRMKIYEAFEEGKTYTVCTYPRKKKGVTFNRDYYVYDDNDALMAAGMSQWCVINFRTRRIERTDIDIEGECIDRIPFEDGIGKIKCDEMELRTSHRVTVTDLDKNGHMNNCRYADIAYDTAREAFPEHEAGCREELNIHFSKEAKLGDEILIYMGRSSDIKEGTDRIPIVVTGKLEDGTLIFQAELS